MDRRDGDRRRRRLMGLGGFDADAQIYFDAVVANGGVLSTTEKNAYNVYRINSKTNLYNPNCHIDLPMIGGTVESMVINAQNPGTFDQIAVNTIAGDFTANGFQPNGVDSYFRMGLIPSVTLTIQSVALEYYSRDDTDGNLTAMGCRNSVSQRLLLLLRLSNNTRFDSYDNGNGRLTAAQTNSSGGITVTRVSNSDSRALRKGVQYGSTLGTAGGTQPTFELYLGAENNLGSAEGFGAYECAGAGIYDGLSVAKVLSQYTDRQELNTKLSRNV